MNQNTLTLSQAAKRLGVSYFDILAAWRGGNLAPVAKEAKQISARFRVDDLSKWAVERGGLHREINRPREKPRPQANPAKWIAGEAIYVLFEYPYTGVIAYVGRSNNPGARLTGHRNDYTKRKGKWLQGVLAGGGAVACAIIEWVTREDVTTAEAHWIGELLRRGHKLTNTHVPDCYTLQVGHGGYNPSVSFDAVLLEPVAILTGNLERN